MFEQLDLKHACYLSSSVVGFFLVFFFFFNVDHFEGFIEYNIVSVLCFGFF